MSRIGKKSIPVPSGVDFKIDGNQITVKGPKGELKRDLHPLMKIVSESGEARVERPDDSRQSRALHGLTRSLVNNMVLGVTQGFDKSLKIVGVGYRWELKGTTLVLNVGHSHPIEYPAPNGVTFEVDSKANIVKVLGINKESVGQAAAEIRSYRPPEPYKGKGIMYSDEKLIRKAGKTAGSKG